MNSGPLSLRRWPGAPRSRNNHSSTPMTWREEMERAVSLDPAFAKGWLALADLASQAGEHAGAIQALQKAVEDREIEDALDALLKEGRFRTLYR